VANGDVTHADVEGLIQDITFSATSNPTETEVDAFCDFVNNDVNSQLQASGFALDLAVARNITWAQFTKLLGAGAVTLDAIYALREAESARAERWWGQCEKRLDHLKRSGGDFLDAADRDTSAEPQYTPVLVGYSDKRRHLLFRERAAVQQYDDERGLAATSAAWKGRMRRV